jgi:hypothetical protein
MISKDLREKAKEGWFTGSFSLRADRMTRRIGSVLVDLNPFDPAALRRPGAAAEVTASGSSSSKRGA